MAYLTIPYCSISCTLWSLSFQQVSQNEMPGLPKETWLIVNTPKDSKINIPKPKNNKTQTELQGLLPAIHSKLVTHLLCLACTKLPITISKKRSRPLEEGTPRAHQTPGIKKLLILSVFCGLKTY